MTRTAQMTAIDENVVFDGSPTPVLELSRDGKVVSLNRAARKVFAVEPDRLIGRPILSIVVPDDRERIKDFFLRVLQGQQCEWTTRFHRGDRATRAQRVRAVPAGGDGRVDSIIMFTRDLSAGSDGAPEAAQLLSLLENLPGRFTAVLDPQGRIRSSSGMTRTHFRDDVELLGQHYSVLFDPEEDGKALLGAMLEAVVGGDHWMGTLWHQRIDGVSFPARSFVSPYVDRTDGRVIGALIAGRDASVEHMWRGRAQRSERFAAIGEFAASIADEFDEGLSRMEREIASSNGLGAELARLQAFAASVHELATDAGVDRGPIQVSDVARDVIESMDARIAAAGVTTSLDVPEGFPQVTADRSQVRRLLELLLENAVDSVEASGGGWIKMALAVDSGAVVIRVSDSGAAPGEDELHRVFEPFFTTKPGRPGLGLPVARALVQANDGRIWTDLDEDDQAVFAVQLPLDTEPQHRFRPVPLVLSHSRTILVVDDEEYVRTSMRRFLEKVGFDVREAWSGRSALAQITGGQRPELVITDLRMRDGSGFWFLGELERDFPDMLRKTVILTGDPDHVEVKRLVTETGCPVVGKPVEMPELLELLDEFTRRD